MNRKRFSLVFAGIMAAVVMMAAPRSAVAQDTYKLNYFSNNLYIVVSGGIGFPQNYPDALVRISNPGLYYGNLCAMIYVFDQDQQMTECCGCSISHNGLLTVGVDSLTLNPLTGVISKNGVIKIVSAKPGAAGTCDATSNVTPQANLRAWGTHIQNLVGTTYPLTETEFSDSPLGASELSALQSQCSFIGILGSGHGVCSCGGDNVID